MIKVTLKKRDLWDFNNAMLNVNNSVWMHMNSVKNENELQEASSSISESILGKWGNLFLPLKIVEGRHGK